MRGGGGGRATDSVVVSLRTRQEPLRSLWESLYLIKNLAIVDRKLFYFRLDKNLTRSYSSITF